MSDYISYSDCTLDQMRALATSARDNYQKSDSHVYRQLCLDHMTVMVSELKKRQGLNPPLSARFMGLCVLEEGAEL